MAERGTRPAFQQAQYALTAHLRDPARQPAPSGVEERRLRIYRELLYNNVESFIANGFPVLRSLYAEADWHALVRDYFARHRAQTPYFTRIAEEFLQYLQDERGTQPQDPPFLLELAHYEWVELALAISEAEPVMDGVDPAGDLLAGAPQLSPLAWSLAYRYPVHRIGPDCRPQVPPAAATHLLVYRDPQDKVAFMEINAVTARLLQLLAEQPQAGGGTLLRQIADELQHPDPAVVLAGGREILDGLRRRGIILGARPLVHASNL